MRKRVITAMGKCAMRNTRRILESVVVKGGAMYASDETVLVRIRSEELAAVPEGAWKVAMAPLAAMRPTDDVPVASLLLPEERPVPGYDECLASLGKTGRGEREHAFDPALVRKVADVFSAAGADMRVEDMGYCIVAEGSGERGLEISAAVMGKVLR